MNKSNFYSVTLSSTANDPTAATLVSRGSQTGVASRLGAIIQNNNIASGAVLFVSNKPGGNRADWLAIYPTGDIFDNIFTPGDDIWVYSDTASAVVTIRETISQ